MSITIKEVLTKDDFKRFVKLQYDIYKGNQFFVPPIFKDELGTFDKSKNPAFLDSDAKFFLAERDGKIAGRIVVINNKPANLKNKTKNLRFSWFECVDDYEVAEALYDAAENWGKSLGMNTISGPHGFCDLDPQGMLIDGFDKIGTIAGFYHHPYYQSLTEKYGFLKEADYLEFLSEPPYESGIPEKMLNTADWAMKRYGYKLLHYPTAKEYVKHGKVIFQLMEDSFKDNFGTVPLNKVQVDYYIKKYISYVNPDLIKLVADKNDELIGFMITMPNLSKAYQKANGKLYPLGIFHLMKGFKTYDILDFYLAGVRKDYQGKGVDLIMVVEIVKTAMEFGFKYAESNQELENNSKVHSEWKFFNPVMHKRRRIYKKAIKY